jgi:hypothetical protein
LPFSLQGQGTISTDPEWNKEVERGSRAAAESGRKPEEEIRVWNELAKKRGGEIRRPLKVTVHNLMSY